MIKRAGSVVSLAILVMAFLAGCGTAKDTGIQPERVIDLVLSDCRTGAYEEAVKHFDGGPAMMETQPQYVRDYLDQICSKGQVKTYRVRDRLEQGDSTVLIHITTYKDTEQKEGLRTMTWHFAKEKRGWIVTKVE